jgi:predicted nucleic acid-binding protein
MICDTSGLIAALGADQPFSEECVAAMKSADNLIVSPFVLAELDYMVGHRRSPRAAIAVLRELSSGEYDIASFDAASVAMAADVMEAYEDLEIGLADASLVVLAKRYNTNEILTLDQRRFRAIRGLDGRHFRLLPFDAE